MNHRLMLIVLGLRDAYHEGCDGQWVVHQCAGVSNHSLSPRVEDLSHQASSLQPFPATELPKGPQGQKRPADGSATPNVFEPEQPPPSGL